MNPNKHVVITIATDGSTVVEAMNFKGVGCKDATRALEMALAGPGGGSESRPKPDFFQVDTSVQGLLNQ